MDIRVWVAPREIKTYYFVASRLTCLIRYPALDLRSEYTGVFLGNFFICIPRLEKISVVFSRTEGTMDPQPQRYMPWPGKGKEDDGPVQLRALSRSDTDAMIIRLVDGFSPAIANDPDEWNKSATELMQEVAYAFRRDHGWS